MANIKISELSAASSFNDDDYTMIIQNNENKKITKEILFNDLQISDTGWQDLTLSSGIGQSDTTSGPDVGTPQYRKIANKVYIKGGVTFTYSSGSVQLAVLPSNFRPVKQTYFFTQLGGQRVARMYVTPTGGIYCEWIYNLADGSKFTGNVAWLQLNFDFLTD